MSSLLKEMPPLRFARPSRRWRSQAPQRLGILATAEATWCGWVDRRRAHLEAIALPLIARRSARCAKECAELDAATLRQHARPAAVRALGPRKSWSAMTELLAILSEVAQRTGIKVSADLEVIAAATAVMQERVAQISGRERRAVVLALAASGIALSGASVHVLSRDAGRAGQLIDIFAKFYGELGLSSTYVTQEMDRIARRNAYRRDIVHADLYQVGLDYLRDKQRNPSSDRMTRHFAAKLTSAGSFGCNFLLGPMDFGLFEDSDELLAERSILPINLYDEADLFDERRAACDAIAFARRLFAEVDFRRDANTGRIALTESGLRRAERLAPQYGPFWSGQQRRLRLLSVALDCLRLFERNIDYVVRGKAISPLSPTLAAAMANGDAPVRIGTLLAAKEGLVSAHEGALVDSMSIGRFVGRYPRCGAVMTGEQSVTGEFWRAYQLTAVQMERGAEAEYTPVATTVFKAAGEKWRSVALRGDCLARAAISTLIVVSTDAGAEAVSKELAKVGVTVVPTTQGSNGMDSGVAVAVNISSVRDWLEAILDRRDDAICVCLAEAQPSAQQEKRLRALLARTSPRPQIEEFLSWEDPVIAKMKDRTWVSIARRWLGRSRSVARFTVSRAQRRADALNASLREAHTARDELYQRMIAFAQGSKIGSD